MYALQGKYEAAIADFTQYLGIDPKDADSYCNRGLARVLQGQYDQGLADLNKALELTPDDPLALYLRGFVHFKQGRAAAAKTDYEKALRLNPGLGEQEGKGQTELDTYPLVLQGKAPARAGARVHHRKVQLIRNRPWPRRKKAIMTRPWRNSPRLCRLTPKIRKSTTTGAAYIPSRASTTGHR